MGLLPHLFPGNRIHQSSPPRRREKNNFFCFLLEGSILE